MIGAAYMNRFCMLYAASREAVRHNDAKYARRYTLALMDVLYEIYDCATVTERDKLAVMLRQLLHISAVLYNQGVTLEITEFYGLNKIDDGGVRAEVEAHGFSHSRLGEKIETDGDWCANLFEKYKSSVVTISGGLRGKSRSGTGFLIGRGGYLLTNHHVVFDPMTNSPLSALTMKRDGEAAAREVKVVASDEKSDVALCAFDGKAEDEKLRAIPMIDDYGRLRQGAEVLVIGNAFSLGLAPFTGTVRFTRDGKGDLVYTAASNPGDSGGPVLNRAGECVGINKYITESIVRGGQRVRAQGLTSATPSDKIKELLSKWIGDKARSSA